MPSLPPWHEKTNWTILERSANHRDHASLPSNPSIDAWPPQSAALPSLPTSDTSVSQNTIWTILELSANHRDHAFWPSNPGIDAWPPQGSRESATTYFTNSKLLIERYDDKFLLSHFQQNAARIGVERYTDKFLLSRCQGLPQKNASRFVVFVALLCVAVFRVSRSGFCFCFSVAQWVLGKVVCRQVQNVP